MVIRLIRDLKTLDAYKETWNKLLHGSKANHVFLAFEWMRDWFSVYAENNELIVLLAEENDEIIGIAPLYLETIKILGIFPFRQIRFIGDQYVGSDFLDLIIFKGRERDVTAAFLEHINNNLYWNRILLRDINEDSVLIQLLQLFSKNKKYHCYTQRRFRCPYHELPNTMREFMIQGDARYKKSARKKFIKLQHQYPNLECILSVHDDHVENALEILFFLQIERWKTHKAYIGFKDERLKKFYHCVSKDLLKKGWLQLSALKVNGEYVAMLYGMIYNNTYYFLTQASGTRGRSMSAGSILLYKTFEDLVGKIYTYHYLRGEEPYKYKWGAIDTYTHEVHVCKGFIGGCILLIIKLWKSIKKFKKYIIKRNKRYFSIAAKR